MMGEIFALSAALVWAIAVICFRKSGETVHPIALNLFKNVVGMILVLPTMLLMRETLLHPASGRVVLLLLLSGAIGIGISDTLFFKSLNLLGAGMSAIVDCLYSPFIILLSILFLDERLRFLQVIGIILIVSAVFAATFEKKDGAISRRNMFLGVTLGILAMATVALSIVMIKPLLAHLPILWTSEVRFLGGFSVLGLALLLHPGRARILAFKGVKSRWPYMVVGSFLGSFLALVFWLAGMKYAQASIAAALNQTSNLFVFIFAALLLKEPINLQRGIGITLGVGGVFLVLLG